MGKFVTTEEIRQAKLMVDNGELSEDELEEMVLFGNPDLWAEEYLKDPRERDKDLKLRGYQKEVLSEHKTICLRFGRQIGKTVILAVRIIWEIFTEPNLTILVYAPRKKHIKQIFDYIEMMTRDSPILEEYLLDRKNTKKKLKEPEDSIPRIEVANGSKVLFFHTQNKVAREQIRGTPGDKLFFEEAHYIDEEAFQAVAGVITSAKELFIWAQSTPRGKHGWFYDFSLAADLESHHTSMESPDWNKDKEKMARLLAPDEGTYRREYLAEFVSDGWTAFTDKVIDLCMQNAAYEHGGIEHQGVKYFSAKEIEDMPGELYIGVDWNIAVHGVKIILMKAPSTGTGRIYYQGVYSIESPTYTQLSAIDKIFEIIDRYNSKDTKVHVRGVTIDQGFAGSSAELIEKKLTSPQYKWLEDKFHVVDFGENIHIPKEEFFEVPNYGKEEIIGADDEDEAFIKLPFKVFMVSIMTRMMISSDLAIGPVDIYDERKTLPTELRSVSVDRVGVNGYPVYSKKDLHKFAATMLSVYGYFLNNGQYYIIKEGKNKVLRKHESEPAVSTFWADEHYPSWWMEGEFSQILNRTTKGRRGILDKTKSAARNELEDDFSADMRTKPASFISVGPETMNKPSWANVLDRSRRPGRRSI